jgi:putative endonuclease
MERGGYVYFMTNINNSVIYTGVTSKLRERANEHKIGKYPNSFTARYNCHKLVYFESFISIEEAIAREKQIKAGSRSKKESLINRMNAEWNDLYQQIKEFLD